MVPQILVINPNSNRSVTDRISAALDELYTPSGVATGIKVECRTLVDGPFGIESEEDIQEVIPLLVAEISAGSKFAAYVIACYSDPGLAECRAATDKPVFGIHESAVQAAVAGRRRFGVLALGAESIERHISYVRELGLQEFHAGERALNVSVDEAANHPDTLHKIISAGQQLLDEEGAEVLVLGCAGMTVHRYAAEQSLGVLVIDPTLAAVAQAMKKIRGQFT
jgi:allantoin racemase